ncbi:predicted protein [Naegleria gruberi]|uniref:Transcription initiation factor TFIID subunit 2 n=1 Tax=Naegleria gruberi TaxID=5762 RepID=D2V9A2_NAEGR|nr:uncharacterized protein NAEGRDRAFT_65369 [Naegleria gruberi]EFC46425.1 predicted protein [Naegleria gruberi]|eukprot:XP_002679169.1 predicted protein [Naegleria gruberi strain NEG-M]
MLASTPAGEHGVVFQPNNNNINFNNQYSVASPSMMNGSESSYQQEQYYTSNINNNNGYPQNNIPSQVTSSMKVESSQVDTSKKDQKSEKKKKKKKSTDKKARSAEPRLPYKVLHQKLVLDVDLYQKALIGYTDIIITPFHNNIDQISLHCLQSNVTGVHALFINKLKSQPIVQQNEDQIQQVTHNNIQNQVNHHDLEVSIKEFMLQYDIENEGTLTIKFKTPLLKKTTSSIRIFFDLKNPLSGVYFVDTTSKNDQSMIDDNELNSNTSTTQTNNNDMIDENLSSLNSTMPHMYTQSQMQGARCWFPCVDLLSSFHSFEFEITSHAEAMIICSGDLIKQVENYSGTLKTSYFKTKSIISPSSVCIAVGPFNISYSSLTLNSYDLILNAFYLPSYSLESIRHTLGFVKRALIFLEDYLEFKYKDLFNLNTLNIVFIENGYTKQSTFSGICLLDSNQMILEPNIIDTVQDNRMSLVRLITEQFFGNFIHSKTWSDYWLIEGIAGYLAYQYYESEFGQNAKRFKIMKAGKELLSIENHTQSLYIENYCHPSELLTEYLLKKSPLVIYMIDRQISTSNMRNLLNKFLKNAHTLDSKRYNDRLISSSSFIKTIGKTFATDLKEFSSYWIYGTGIPQFAISFKYDDMRSCVDLKVKQILPFPEIQPFRGKVTVRILESEGAPNDFIANLDKEENQFEFHINSKPIKKHHKKVQGGQGQPTEAVRVIIPLKWIRFDPEQDWIKVQSFSQTQEMWNYQLNDVKDVVAQYESIKALTFFADTEPVITILNRILRDNSYYYQIRVCAAHALSKIPQPIEKKEALNVLIGFFKTQFYDEQLTYLKPNNFKNFADYFLKKEIPLALTNFKDDKVNNETFPEVVLLLLELIKYNDDSENLFSGNFYIANLIKSISLLNTSNPNFNQKIEKILYKYLVIDSDLIPSYHYIKTVTSLESIANLQSSGKSKINLDVFYRYLDFKKSDHVRFSSWRCVMNILDSILDSSSLNNNNMNGNNLNNNNLNGNNLNEKNIITSSGELISECYSNVELLTHVKIIFNRFISLLNDENETSHAKYEITKIITQSIFNCSARMLLEFNNKKVSLAFIKKVSALGLFLIDIRLSKITNRKLVDLIWNYLHDSKYTQFDFKLRSIIMNLYKSIWSSNIPLCYDSKFVNSNNFDHAILVAPSLYGITDLKIVQPQQLKSHQYLASEQPRVVFDSSQLSNFISSPALAPTIFTTSQIDKKKRSSKSSSAALSSLVSSATANNSSSTGSGSGSSNGNGLSVVTSLSTPTTITISTAGQSTVINSILVKKDSKKKESSSSSKSKSSSKKESSSSDKKDKDSSESKKKDKDSEKKKSKKDSDKKDKDSEKKRKRDSEKSSPSSSSKKKKEVVEPVTPTTVKIKLNTPITTPLASSSTSMTTPEQPKKKKPSSKSKSEKLTTPALTSEKSTSSSASASSSSAIGSSSSSSGSSRGGTSLSIKKEINIDDQLVTPAAAATTIAQTQEIGKNEKESIEKKLKNREAKKNQCKATRLILITFDTSEIKVYVELDDDSPTADVIYRSVPLASPLVQSPGKGIVYFTCEIEHIELEETARSEVKQGEIAFWVSGTAFVLGFGKTVFSLANETRLYQPCNIFGEMMYPVKSLQKTALQQKVTVSRFPRVYIDLPELDKRIDIDMYDTFKDITNGYIAPRLPFTRQFMPLFGRILYFNIGHIDTSHLESVSPGFHRDYLYPGEIAYWAGGDSLLLGTGPTDIKKHNHNSKEIRYNLLENCFIIGKIVSADYNLLPDLIEKYPHTPLYFNRRELVITIDFEPNLNEQINGEGAVNSLDILIGVSGTMSGDIIFDTCFNGYETRGHEITQPQGDKCGIVGIKLNPKENPILETLQHEINNATETAKPQEVVLFWDSHTIGFPFSNNPETAPYNLPEMANPFGSFKQVLNMEMSYYQFINFLQNRKVKQFTITKREIEYN